MAQRVQGLVIGGGAIGVKCAHALPLATYCRTRCGEEDLQVDVAP